MTPNLSGQVSKPGPDLNRGTPQRNIVVTKRKKLAAIKHITVKLVF